MEFVTAHLGIDLGKRPDPTAICVSELQRRSDGVHYIVRHLERILDQSYPDQIERIRQIYHRVTKRGHRAKIYLDATGLGEPVSDILRQRRLPLVSVYLTGSERAVWEDDGKILRLGKSQLVSRMQVLLSFERIHLPKTDEAEAMVAELAEYEIRVNERAHAQFGAFRTGKHDDLATSLGLSCWHEPEFRPRYRGTPKFMAGVARRKSNWMPEYARSSRLRDKFRESGGMSNDRSLERFGDVIEEILKS